MPILLVRGSTIQTIGAIDRLCGKARLGEPAKMEPFTHLLEEGGDGSAIRGARGLA